MSRRSQKAPLPAVVAPPAGPIRPRARREAILAIVLAVGTLALYAPTWWYGALSIDDPSYVVDNVHVTTGLTSRNVVWSFTSVYDSNWIPLTWLSLMLDVDLYGGRASGFHVTNTLLHAACAVLLFLVLARATGSELRSAFVAALFAIHPLHVESVAWIAERKDVLSIFFGLLALLAYVRYAKGSGRVNLVLAFVCLALSLMAKQTLVTLPFVFLLLDYWPLGRLPLRPQGVTPEAPTAQPAARSASLGRLVVEKLPFLGLSVAFSAIASVAQSRGGAVVLTMPFYLRVMNAIAVYVIYLAKTFIPINLAVYYPHPGYKLNWIDVVLSAILLLAVTAFAFFRVRRLPYLFVGWCWYLGTLVPMIGLVQIGGQQMADRYTYFPLIGIFLAVTWLVAEWAPEGAPRSRILPAAAALVVAILAGLSFHQIGYWRDSISLLGHDVDVMPHHPTPHEYLGAAYLYAELPAKAIPELETAIRLAPPYAPLQYKLASAFDKVGRGDEAVEHYQAALALDEKSAKPHNDFAVLLMSRHQDSEARRHLERAVELDPDLANAHANLSLLSAKTRDYPRAIAEGERALALDPKQIDCYHYIAVALRGELRFDQAIQTLEQLLKIAPDYDVARKELEITRAMQQRQHR
ncbi:MAG TPA: tetratricopeptide repeat protein [Planctomycetaceae bacterium]|jgi:Tfp pilus assembly protein PilF|nr:tetratricopeptide repeat protein [Planctomycetaceae bacterium]